MLRKDTRRLLDAGLVSPVSRLPAATVGESCDEEIGVKGGTSLVAPVAEEKSY